MKFTVNFFLALVLFSSFIEAQNFLPNIPNKETNPFRATMFNRVQTGIETQLHSFAMGEDMSQTVVAYCHPESLYYNLPAYKDRLLFLLDYVLDLSDPGETYYANFGVFEKVAFAYATLKATFPDTITAAQKTSWEAKLKAQSDYLIANRGQYWKDKNVEFIWYNADIRWALGVYLTGIATADNYYKTYGQYFFDETLQLSLLQPDGGFNYVGYQNETFTYHAENIEALAWYYLITGDNAIKSIIQKTKNYYPLTVSNGVAEYYTASSWKHYWNQSKGEKGAYIVASLTLDPYNYDLGKTASNSLLLPFFYNPNLTAPASTPNNYILADKNIMGPRGRFNNFYFAGTSRNVDNYPNPTLGVGKNTLVGAMVLDETGTSWPLNASLDFVTVEVKKAAGVETQVRRNSFWLTNNEKSSLSKSKQIYGLTSKYNPSTKQNVTENAAGISDWEVKQNWIFTPQRLVGQIQIQPTKNTSAYAVHAILKLVSGRAGWGEKKDLDDLGNNLYSYGNLFFKIHETTFNGATEQSISSVYTESDSSEKSAILVLKDPLNPPGYTEQLHSYTPADSFYYIVEVFPNTESSISQISNTRSANLQTLTVNDTSREITTVHNSSENKQTYTNTLNFTYSNALILKSWDATETIGAVSGPTTISIEIPANEHIVIINSNFTDDLDSIALAAEDIYTNNPEISNFETNLTAVKVAQDAGWSYYAPSGSIGTSYLFAIEHTPAGAGANTQSFEASINFKKLCNTSTSNVHKKIDLTNAEGLFSLGYDWNITLSTGSTNGWVNLRWFKDTDLENELESASANFKNITAALYLSPQLHLKSNLAVLLPNQLSDDGQRIDDTFSPILQKTEGTYLGNNYAQYNSIDLSSTKGGGLFRKVTNKTTTTLSETGIKGTLRYNTTTDKLEGYDGEKWVQL
tara:strand:+ start:1023 stop:3773 length:2751 start_codon:yes stop_codon:yes gene_type:complete